MNYNTWLAKNGYLAQWRGGERRPNLEDLFDQGDFFVNVDWSRTKAYALGLGNIYINLAGREAKGIVKPGDGVRAGAPARSRRGSRPTSTRRPASTRWRTSSPARRRTVGYDPMLMPDLFVENSLGYRVGWQDRARRHREGDRRAQPRHWSGDHCSVYPPLVKGIFFTTGS